MDKTQLVTIAVTALISVTAKEVVTWLVALLKNTAAAKTITAKIKAMFTEANRAVFFDILVLLFYVVVLVNFALDKAAPTKLDILIAIGAVLACVFMSIALFIDIFKASHASNKNP